MAPRSPGREWKRDGGGSPTGRRQASNWDNSRSNSSSRRRGRRGCPVRACPRALRYDFLPRLHPIQSAATNGRLIALSATSNVAAMVARLSGRGRPLRARPPRWPIPVEFADPRTGVRKRLVVKPCQPWFVLSQPRLSASRETLANSCDPQMIHSSAGCKIRPADSAGGPAHSRTLRARQHLRRAQGSSGIRARLRSRRPRRGTPSHRRFQTPNPAHQQAAGNHFGSLYRRCLWIKGATASRRNEAAQTKQPTFNSFLSLPKKNVTTHEETSSAAATDA